MELIDFLNQLKHLEYSHKKYHVDRHGEYAQLVFARSCQPQWLETIEKILGKPVKTEDEPVSQEIIRLTEDFGEIFDHQTLFYRETDQHRMIAMFWPWSNQESITLKIMILSKN